MRWISSGFLLILYHLRLHDASRWPISKDTGHIILYHCTSYFVIPLHHNTSECKIILMAYHFRSVKLDCMLDLLLMLPRLSQIFSKYLLKKCQLHCNWHGLKSWKRSSGKVLWHKQQLYVIIKDCNSKKIILNFWDMLAYEYLSFAFSCNGNCL